MKRCLIETNINLYLVLSCIARTREICYKDNRGCLGRVPVRSRIGLFKSTVSFGYILCVRFNAMDVLVVMPYNETEHSLKYDVLCIPW